MAWLKRETDSAMFAKLNRLLWQSHWSVHPQNSFVSMTLNHERFVWPYVYKTPLAKAWSISVFVHWLSEKYNDSSSFILKLCYHTKSNLFSIRLHVGIKLLSLRVKCSHSCNSLTDNSAFKEMFLSELSNSVFAKQFISKPSWFIFPKVLVGCLKQSLAASLDEEDECKNKRHTGSISVKFSNTSESICC